MSYVVLYLATAVVFLAIDVVGLKVLLKPMFDRHVGDLMAAETRMGAAALFYSFYVVGILYFASIAGLNGASYGAVARDAAFLGLIAYGTYEATNYATLRGWDLSMVLTDVVWGGVLTAASAVIGLAITRALGF